MKEGIEERRSAREVPELEVHPLCERCVKTRCGLNVDDLQAIEPPHRTQYPRNVKFLLRTQPVEGQRQRGDEANIIDRIL